MKITRFAISLATILPLLLITIGCRTIPKDVPVLIEVSAGTVDNQAARIISEWEAAIAAANASKLMLELIQPFIANIEKATLSDIEAESIDKFLRGYPYVLHQIEEVLAQSNDTQATLRRMNQITDAIRLANSYVSEVADENARIKAVIEQIRSLSNSREGSQNESGN